jgi:hypothetical protein
LFREGVLLPTFINTPAGHRAAAANGTLRDPTALSSTLAVLSRDQAPASALGKVASQWARTLPDDIGPGAAERDRVDALLSDGVSMYADAAGDPVVKLTPRQRQAAALAISDVLERFCRRTESDVRTRLQEVDSAIADIGRLHRAERDAPAGRRRPAAALAEIDRRLRRLRQAGLRRWPQ